MLKKVINLSREVAFSIYYLGWNGGAENSPEYKKLLNPADPNFNEMKSFYLQGKEDKIKNLTAEKIKSAQQELILAK